MIRPRLTAETYVTIDDIVRVGNRAVANAQDESRRLGVPNVYSINGRLFYETSTGELSTVDPYVSNLHVTEQADEREPE
jgi:hypothetical protein